MPKLSELGERKLVEWLKRFLRNHSFLSKGVVVPIGDDCGGIRIPRTGSVLVTTTDPCPLPLAHRIGFSKDLFDMGWYTAVINLSDIASMGAEPLGIMASVKAQNDMRLDELKRF